MILVIGEPHCYVWGPNIQTICKVEVLKSLSVSHSAFVHIWMCLNVWNSILMQGYITILCLGDTCISVLGYEKKKTIWPVSVYTSGDVNTVTSFATVEWAEWVWFSADCTHYWLDFNVTATVRKRKWDELLVWRKRSSFRTRVTRFFCITHLGSWWLCLQNSPQRTSKQF